MGLIATLVAAGIFVMSGSIALADQPAIENPRLQKVCAELDEFYGAYLKSSVPSATSVNAQSGAAATENFDLTDHFRKTIQFSKSGDTTWVKVVITVDDSRSESARASLVDEGLRRVTQFGSLISGQLPIQNLPQVDQMHLVERIEPVTPSAYTARTSTFAENFSKKN